MRRTVLLAGPDLDVLFALSMQLGASVAPTIIEAQRPVQSLLRRPTHADAAIVYLAGDENVVDLRAMFDAHEDTRFLLLAPSFPPHAAIARIVAEHGGVVLPQGESSVVITATLVAMLSGKPQDSVASW